MDKWVGIGLASVGAMNVIVLALLTLGRWSQKVESPVTIARLSWDIQALTKEIGELRKVFDDRYTGMEGRFERDHQRLNAVITDKVGSDLRISALRKDVDELLVRNGVTMNGVKHGEMP